MVAVKVNGVGLDAVALILEGKGHVQRENVADVYALELHGGGKLARGLAGGLARSGGGGDDDLALLGAACGDDVLEWEEYYEYDGNLYHAECFLDKANELFSDDIVRRTAEADEYWPEDDD